tara:strand:+ start:4377 stop:4751 length:375 start_codon:yes stop_codon:yes gene_type:complete
MSNPITSDELDGFRAGLACCELMLASCDACGTVLDYSARYCTACGSPDIGWRKASGKAELRCVVEMSVSYTLELPAPFLIASVKLQEGPHLLAPYIGLWESTHGGQSVVAHFKNGSFHFRPVAA